MSVSINDININHYLVGFHAFRKDHNYVSFKGNFINDISESFDFLLLEQFDTGPITILKSPERHPLFEIKLSANQLIYQDVLDVNEIIKKAKILLELWRKHSNLVALKHVGIIYYFKINIQKEGKDSFQLLLNHFKGFDTLNDISRIGFNLNYRIVKEKQKYRVNLSLNQSDKSGPIEGFIDFHLVNDKIKEGISDDEINKVFLNANEYFKNDFIKFLNRE